MKIRQRFRRVEQRIERVRITANKSGGGETGPQGPVGPTWDQYGTMYVAPSASTSAMMAQGVVIAEVGTKSHPSQLSPATRWDGLPRKRFTSAAAAGSGCGVRSTVTSLVMATADGASGGFMAQIAFRTVTDFTGATCLCGLARATAALTADASTAFANTVFVGFDPADVYDANATFYLVTRYGSTTPTRVAIAGMLRQATNGWVVRFTSDRAAPTGVTVSVYNANTNALVYTAFTTTTLPPSGYDLGFRVEMNNLAVASAVAIDVHSIYARYPLLAA